jgi:AraC-like DNA-binding protein
MILVRRGKMLASVKGEEYVISGGEGCFVDRFCVHSFSELENDTEIYVFVGNNELLDPIFEDACGVPPVRFLFDDYTLLDMAVNAYNAAETEETRLLAFKGAVSLLIARIADENGVEPSPERVSSSDICAVLRYIGEHFSEDITLGSIASEFGYSPQYFSRLFHRYMKVNLTEYVNIARVNYAKRLMGSDKNVAEIAFESGFNSMPSFYRAYKKVFGELPRG